MVIDLKSRLLVVRVDITSLLSSLTYPTAYIVVYLRRVSVVVLCVCVSSIVPVPACIT